VMRLASVSCFVNSGTRRNGLSEADLDVSAKLPEQRLERKRRRPARKVAA
jgi:hypothetical protein